MPQQSGPAIKSQGLYEFPNTTHGLAVHHAVRSLRPTGADVGTRISTQAPTFRSSSEVLSRCFGFTRPAFANEFNAPPPTRQTPQQSKLIDAVSLESMSAVCWARLSILLLSDRFVFVTRKSAPSPITGYDGNRRTIKRGRNIEFR